MVSRKYVWWMLIIELLSILGSLVVFFPNKLLQLINTLDQPIGIIWLVLNVIMLVVFLIKKSWTMSVMAFLVILDAIVTYISAYSISEDKLLIHINLQTVFVSMLTPVILVIFSIILLNRKTS